jgi:hypothetical protein
LGSPRLKEPCIYTQGRGYLHVKKELYYMAIRIYIIRYQNQTIEAFRRNVWGTIAWQERSIDLILIGD